MGKLLFSKLDHTMELVETFHNRQAHCSHKAQKNIIASIYGKGLYYGLAQFTCVHPYKSIDMKALHTSFGSTRTCYPNKLSNAASTNAKKI